MGVEVEIIGDVLTGIMGRVKAMNGAEVTIGVHPGAADYPDGTSVEMVGWVQEAGATIARGDEAIVVPARPFVRGFFDSGGARVLGDEAAQAVGLIIDGGGVETSLEPVATVGQDGVRSYVTTGRAAPEGGDNPDPLTSRTGHLVSQIKGKVKA